MPQIWRNSWSQCDELMAGSSLPSRGIKHLPKELQLEGRADNPFDFEEKQVLSEVEIKYDLLDLNVFGYKGVHNHNVQAGTTKRNVFSTLRVILILFLCVSRGVPTEWFIVLCCLMP